MAAISRRWRGGRIYNNTRTRELLRRKCVKPADLTTHSPPKTVAHPRTATRTARAFSHSLPEHFSSPSPRRRTPADLTTHSPPKTFARPRTTTPPSCTLPLPRPATMHARKLRHARPPTSQPIPRRRPSLLHAQRHALPEHFRSPPQPRRTPAGCAMHSQPTAQPIPRRSPSLAPAQRHALPEHFRSPPAAPTHARRLRDVFPADLTTHSPPKTFARPRTATRPRRALPLPHAAPTHARRLRDAFPAALTTHSPPKAVTRPRTATRPPPPFRFGHKKNGTAQWMCDAECLGRPSLRSVIGVGEPRAVRRRCGALAWRVGLRPQPWALRSRRCGRVLRA